MIGYHVHQQINRSHMKLQAFSVVATGHNGTLDLVRMDKEEPLDKSSTGQPRVG